MLRMSPRPSQSRLPLKMELSRILESKPSWGSMAFSGVFLIQRGGGEILSVLRIWAMAR